MRKREAARYLVEVHARPVRRSCECVGLSESAWYRPPLDWTVRDAELIAALAKLVAEAKAVLAPGGGAVRRAPDAMSHTITVEGDSQPPVVLRQSDAAMSDAFAALLEWIEEHAEAG